MDEMLRLWIFLEEQDCLFASRAPPTPCQPPSRSFLWPEISGEGVGVGSEAKALVSDWVCMLTAAAWARQGGGELASAPQPEGRPRARRDAEPGLGCCHQPLVRSLFPVPLDGIQYHGSFRRTT